MKSVQSEMLGTDSEQKHLNALVDEFDMSQRPNLSLTSIRLMGGEHFPANRTLCDYARIWTRSIYHRIRSIVGH